MPRPFLGVLFLVVSANIYAQEPASILENARQRALAFDASLPDFICSELVRRFQGPSGGEPIRETDLVTLQLNYIGGKENYELTSVDGRPVHGDYSGLGGAYLHGEFGSILHSIFDPSSQAEFKWERLEDIGPYHTAVFSYQVRRANSHYELRYREDVSRLDTVTVPHHGLVYIDLATLSVLRAFLQADDIPPHFPLKSSAILLESGFAEIAGRTILLPSRVETRTSTAKFGFKNEMEFSGYRKFEATAALRFDEPTETQPLANAPTLKVTPTAAARTHLRNPLINSLLDLGAMRDEARMPSPLPEPSLEISRAALREARIAAASYLTSSPAFACNGTFRILSRRFDQERWSLRSEVAFQMKHVAQAGGAPAREDYHLVRSDSDARLREYLEKMQASAWNNEFRRLVNSVLDPGSPSRYRWDHWIMLRGRRTLVYSFELNPSDSHYAVNQTRVGLNGLVYIDSATQRLARIFAEASEIPDAGIKGQSVFQDFEIGIHGSSLTLLPVRAVMRMDSGKLATRYDSEFACAAR